MKFLKNFGLGLLYALLLPLILAGVALFAVYGFLKSVVYFFLYVVRFFKGEKIFAPFPEDVKAKEVLDRAHGLNEEAPSPQPAPQQNIYVQQNYYPNQSFPQQSQQPSLSTPPYPQQALPNQNPYAQPLPPYEAQSPYPQAPSLEQQPSYIAPNPSIQSPQPEAITLNRVDEETLSHDEEKEGEDDD